MSLLWRWFVNLLCFLGASSANLPCSPYALFASPAFALSSTGSPETARAAREVIFDLDSAQLGLDTLASASLTPSPADFIDTPVPCNVPFRGLGNGSATLRGTVAWHVADDDGVTRRLLIPNTYYIPGLPLRILSPQHLAQELRPHETRPDGTYLTCYSDRIQLTWLDRRFLLTAPLNDANVGIARTVPSYAGALSCNDHNLYSTVTTRGRTYCETSTTWLNTSFNVTPVTQMREPPCLKMREPANLKTRSSRNSLILIYYQPKQPPRHNSSSIGITDSITAAFPY
ncbi:hypothetical protein IV203_019833 [Nitzschia inconspicua]|uniref:Uncharacterized protein n=1 Tax=Nitzschia inconspicua TaxID=303405 RepID=A0A9K3Q4Y2_9STRA|nr:hypothetical protein IV203_019833 [Nitzschia inconspicua]